MEVAGGGAEAVVPEQDLDGPQVGAGLEQVSRKAVTQRISTVRDSRKFMQGKGLVLKGTGPLGVAMAVRRSRRGLKAPKPLPAKPIALLQSSLIRDSRTTLSRP